MGDCTLDQGAQFRAPPHPSTKAMCDTLVVAGAIGPWDVGYVGKPLEDPQYRGAPTMTAAAKHMAAELDVPWSHNAESLSSGPADQGGWLAHTEGGGVIRAQGLVIASPVPQTLNCWVQASAAAAVYSPPSSAAAWRPCSIRHA